MDVFIAPGSAPQISTLRKIATRLRAVAETIKRDQRRTDLLNRSSYLLLVDTATQIAVSEKLIEP